MHIQSSWSGNPLDHQGTAHIAVGRLRESFELSDFTAFRAIETLLAEAYRLGGERKAAELRDKLKTLERSL